MGIFHRIRMKSPTSRILACLILSICVSSALSWTFNRPATSRATPQTFPDHDASRRNVLGTAASSVSVAGTLMTILCPQPAIAAAAAAAAATDLGEAVRKSASNIPGYGPSDVYFPASWQGLYRIKREVLRSTGDPLILDYKVRFLPSSDGNNKAAVADRGYNQVNLEAALRGDSSSSTSSIRSCDWSANNPNDLLVHFSDGSSKGVKVTKRATELTETTVFSSEFQRVSQVDAVTGIPVVTARRVLTKWKERTASSREGLEIIYEIGGGGDPLAAAGLSSSSQADQQKVLSKSRLVLERIIE